MSGEFLTIAVDGGAASGKSSTSQLLAARLGLLYVNSGAHYRAITSYCLEKGLTSDRPQDLEAPLAALRIGTRIDSETVIMLLDERSFDPEDLTKAEVNRRVSQFSALPLVRRILLDYQRTLPELARKSGFRGIVMEGRDIGSVVLPEAPFKFFLEASPRARALRRLKEGITDSIIDRDTTDSIRAIAPLVCPPEAIRIDNSKIPLEEVVERIARVLQESSNN